MRTKLLLTAFLLVNTGFFLACGTGYTEPSSNSNNGSNNQGSISTSDSAENQVTAATEASGTSFTASKTLYVNLTDKKYSENNTDFTVISTTKALVLNSTASIKLGIDSDGNSTDVIRIDVSDVTSNTSIVFTGTLTTGGVKIQTGKTYETGLTLKDCSITSSNYPCIECTKKGSVSVKLEGTNTLTDGRFYGTGYGEEYSTTSGVTYTDDDGVVCNCTVVRAAVKNGSDSKATLVSKGSMAIYGTGTLTITQNYKNCIASKDGILTIQGGTFNLTSNGKAAINGGEQLKITGGTITCDCTGAIYTNETINGEVFRVLRKAHGFTVDTDDYSLAGVDISGGTINLNIKDGKGITASYVNISGGVVVANVSGVTTYAENSTTTGTYYNANGEQQTNQTISFAAEGIEGDNSVKISGGEIQVTAVDDGINVGTEGGLFSISDGKLYVYSSRGDGVDCNGNIAISGGTLVSLAPTGSEDCLDCGDSAGGMAGGANKTGPGGRASSTSYSISITGGYVAGACGSSMAMNDYSVSNQHMLYSTSASGISSIGVTVSDSAVFGFKLPASTFSVIVLSCPAFTSSSKDDYLIVKGAELSGKDYNGLYTSLSSISGGSSTSFTLK